jgi:hypothetical protein
MVVSLSASLAVPLPHVTARPRPHFFPRTMNAGVPDGAKAHSSWNAAI